MKKFLISAVLSAIIVGGGYSAETKQSDAWSNMQGYIGVGLAGTSIATDLAFSGTLIGTHETSAAGLNLNGGVKWKYLRLGADITSASGITNFDSAYLGIYGLENDVSSVKYALEAAGIIPLTDTVHLEAGLSIGALGNRLKGMGGVCLEGLDCDAYAVYGLLFGVVINFTENHAMSILLKGFGYGGADGTIDYSGAIGEFAIGYRYSF